MRTIRQVVLVTAALAAVSALMLPLSQRIHPSHRPDFETAWRQCLEALIEDVRRAMRADVDRARLQQLKKD